MNALAEEMVPAQRRYSGAFTRPERWATWTPRVGDILVCTPPKSGTTWTQTILSMLVHGGPDLPRKVPVMSPWVDADLGVPAAEVAAELSAQTGRRVVKTHTPADGFPVWKGVTVITVYRHPLDVFFSLRKHTENMVIAKDDHPMRQPVPASLKLFLEGTVDIENFDLDSLTAVALHYSKSLQADRADRAEPLHRMHYADMVLDGRRAVQKLAQAAGIDAEEALIDAVARATAFGQMRANSQNYTPVAGTGFWKSDNDFFHSGTSNKWQDHLSDDDLAQYHSRLAALIPDPEARRWLEGGNAAVAAQP